jgi:hypothetical protein
MPIAIAPRPKVLFIGHSSGSPEHDAKIREVADVHCITGMPYEDSIPIIAEAVERHGPFVAFGVGVKPVRLIGTADFRACSFSGTSSR